MAQGWTKVAQITSLRHIVMEQVLTHQIAFMQLKMMEILLGNRAYRCFLWRKSGFCATTCATSLCHAKRDFQH
jgi:hypothetical protein